MSGTSVTLALEPAGTATGTIDVDRAAGKWSVPGLGGGDLDGSTAACPGGSGPGGVGGVGGAGGTAGAGGGAGAGGASASGGTGGTGGSGGMGGTSAAGGTGGTAGSGGTSGSGGASGSGGTAGTSGSGGTGGFGAPATFATTATTDVNLLEIRGTDVVWAARDGLHVAPRATGVERPLLTSEPASAWAFDGSDVYYATASRIARVPVGGGAPANVTALASAVSPGGMVVGGSTVFFVLGNELYSVSTSGGAASLHSTAPSGNGYAGVTTHLTNLLVSYGNLLQGNISRIPLAGGAATDFFPSLVGYPGAMVVDGSFLFYLAVTGVERVAVAGGTPENVVPGTFVTAWSVHGGEVFASILDVAYRVAAPGGSFDEVGRSTGSSNVYALDADGADVFFADSGGSRIVRVPR